MSAEGRAGSGSSQGGNSKLPLIHELLLGCMFSGTSRLILLCPVAIPWFSSPQNHGSVLSMPGDCRIKREA